MNHSLIVRWTAGAVRLGLIALVCKVAAASIASGEFGRAQAGWVLAWYGMVAAYALCDWRSCHLRPGTWSTALTGGAMACLVAGAMAPVPLAGAAVLPLDWWLLGVCLLVGATSGGRPRPG